MLIADHSIKQLNKLLKAKEVSVTELTQLSLQEIESSADLNAFITVNKDQALARARELDKKLLEGENINPLFGLPVGIKDTIMTEGIRTTAASQILSDYIGVYDATTVAKLKAAGVVIVGKNNCDEFAMGGSGEYSAFGPTFNPWDKERVPGGSSSGSAVAVAAGSIVFSLGSDTGGSIRQPAAFCGVVGLKPTYGLVSRYGLIAMASSFDVIGPFARTVEDAALVLSAIAGHDRHDATSLSGSLFALDKINPEKKFTIGIPVQYFSKGLASEIENAIRKMIDKLANAGHKVVEVSLPSLDYALAVYYVIVPAEVSSNLAKFDGLRYGRRFAGKVDDIIDYYIKARGEGLGEEAKRRILLGTFILSAGYIDKYYIQAQKARTKIKQDFDKIFQEVDLLIGPTTPTLPFAIGEKSNDPVQMYLSDVYTVAVNIAGLPALSVPIALSQNNLPIGMQIIGPALSEDKMLSLGRAIEALRGEWSFPINK